MSYTSPKYINTSQADLYQNLQNTISKVVTDTKKANKQEEYEADVQKNAEIVAGGNASAQSIKNQNSHDYGGEQNSSLVESYFDNYTTPDGKVMSYEERAKEIAMELEKKPKPENYGKLKAELEMINGAPQAMHTGLENLLSQLDTTGRDIDQTGNSNILLASYIFQGKNGYKPGESNFSYKMVPGPNGSIDFVFSGEGEVNGNNIGFKGGSWSINSKELSALENGDKDIIQSKISETSQVNSVIKDSNFFPNAEYNDDGEITSYGKLGDNFVESFRMEGDADDPGNTTKIKYKDSDGETKTMDVWNLDKNKIRDRVQQSVNVNLGEFLDPQTGDLDRARSYWNNTLSPTLGSDPFDIDVAREAFGDIPEVANMSDEDVKSKWKEAMGAWPSDIKNLTEYQKVMFHKVYTDRAVDDIYNRAMSSANATQRKVTTWNEDNTYADKPV
jgi:hypothetical protein